MYQSVDKKISTGEEVKVESKRNLGTAGTADRGQERKGNLKEVDKCKPS